MKIAFIGNQGGKAVLRRALEETERTAIVQFSLRQKTRLGALGRPRQQVDHHQWSTAATATSCR